MDNKDSTAPQSCEKCPDVPKNEVWTGMDRFIHTLRAFPSSGIFSA